MSIADQINRLNNAKAAIKQSIKNKGVTVSDEAKLDEYPALIDRITTGEGGGSVSDELFYNALTSNGTNYSYLFAYKTIDDPSFIESLDTSKVTNTERAFQSFKSSKLDLSDWDISNVTSISYMFNYATISELDVSGWDTSKIKDMTYVFQDFKGTTITGLDTWDTSNVINMNTMFDGCNALFNISNWDVSNVTNMNGMFNEITLETLDISGWNTSNVKDFGAIYWFIGGNTYTTATQNLKEVLGTLDLTSCTSGMVYSSSYYFAKSLPNLETLYLKNIYKNVTMKNELKWSINLKDTKVKDECLIYIINELPDLINDKGLTATDKIVFTLPPTNTLTAEQVQVAIDKGWNVGNTTY